MKLKDWLRKHYYKHTAHTSDPYETKPNGLHVIGICGKCERAVGSPSLEHGYIYCVRYGHHYEFNYGWIRFRVKGEK